MLPPSGTKETIWVRGIANTLRRGHEQCVHVVKRKARLPLGIRLIIMGDVSSSWLLHAFGTAFGTAFVRPPDDKDPEQGGGVLGWGTNIARRRRKGVQEGGGARTYP
jgi:hypothetical protein